jgi:hypothetical protein
VTAKSGNNIDHNITIKSVQFASYPVNSEKLAAHGNDNTRIIYFKETGNAPSGGTQGTLCKVNYIDVLTITFSYNSYNGLQKDQTRNFLVYHEQYY